MQRHSTANTRQSDTGIRIRHSFCIVHYAFCIAASTACSAATLYVSSNGLHDVNGVVWGNLGEGVVQTSTRQGAEI